MRKFLEGLLKEKTGESFQWITSLPLETLSFFLGQRTPTSKPDLVITESIQQAHAFIEAVEFWSPKKVFLLPDYDPSIFSEVLLSPKQVADRLKWLHHALHGSEETIFVAPLPALLQKTLPLEVFADHSLQLQVGDELPENFILTLQNMGYQARPLVEDSGCFSHRGDLFDIFSPQMEKPVRIELFDRQIEKIDEFDPSLQRRTTSLSQITLIPAREVLLTEKNRMEVSQSLLQTNRPEQQAMLHDLRLGQYSENLEYYLPLFYQDAPSPYDYFSQTPQVWMLEALNIETSRQTYLEHLKSLYDPQRHPFQPENIFVDFAQLMEKLSSSVHIERISIIDTAEDISQEVVRTNQKVFPHFKTQKINEQLSEFVKNVESLPVGTRILVSVRGLPQFERIKAGLEPLGYDSHYNDGDIIVDKIPLAKAGQKILNFYTRKGGSQYHLPSESLALFSFDNVVGAKTRTEREQETQNRAKHLSFGELQEGDYVIHSIHGVSQFKGLTKMQVAGVDAEFIVLEFKDKDKLFLPIYRIHQIHKYTAERVAPQLDKLGGSRFANVKIKTKKKLREIAHDLVKLYAERANCKRPVYTINSNDISDFFNSFPYQETQDQLHAMDDIVDDLTSERPMDRLICGDVGFGKTEIAMRAAFIAAHNRKQVAVLAPTTVLTMQHLETFKKRFKDWPINIRVVNRLQANKEIKETLEKTENGEIDILIGTHRLLSQDVHFKNLGLLIIDEEQKFGVKHKEKIRKLKTSIDTISLSATPIPRTLNMSLLKMRDMSLINTAPVDRLAVRTFICRHDKEIIKRAIETEISRGGQVFFLHNRVQSIYSVADELRQLLPNVPMGVGHGQLPEKELESVVMSFFRGDLKVLIASAIIESGVDIPNANTILINQADKLGLSQLYQLRGRVGRSGRRAYCYLLTDSNRALSDIAKERLKVIQENTKLGSGLQIAQYDLELRGAGTLLGEEQSGVIDSVGYEYYMELLDEAIQEAQGKEVKDAIEPDINLKIKAFIPSTYIANIRLRLAYYRALTQLQSAEDIDVLEEELKDQFGNPPEEVINLLGLMLIRHLCIQLGVKDISSGKESLVLSFTDQTPLPPMKVIELSQMANKKYSIAPGDRLKIRMNDISWPRVFEEINQLLAFCPGFKRLNQPSLM